MPQTDHSLAHKFAQVVRDYFPRWQSYTQWQVKEGPRGRWQDADGTWHTTSEQGYCDATAKTIWIQVGRSEPFRTLVLIHECTHAVTTGAHDLRFRVRLARAAQRAQTLGDTGLRDALLQEVDGYASAQRLGSARDTYAMVEDVIMDVPAITFADIVHWLARQLAITGPELLTNYPRLRQVYGRSRRQHLRMARAQLTHMRTVGNADPRLAQHIVEVEARWHALESVRCEMASK